jgi:short-subunit dehydrogenase
VVPHHTGLPDRAHDIGFTIEISAALRYRLDFVRSGDVSTVEAPRNDACFQFPRAWLVLPLASRVVRRRHASAPRLLAAMLNIRDKKALVTGAASGIGRAIALALAREGAHLYLIDIDGANLAVTAREAAQQNVTVLTRVCDLSDPKQITAAVDSLLSSWGRLDILVNNAGTIYYGPTKEMTAEQWNRVLAVNLLAPIQLVRELLPTLTAQPEAHIVNVSSIFGLVPVPRITAYQTSKFGLVGFSAALRAEYGQHHCGVTALCPGFVRTAMIEEFVTVGFEPDYRIPSWICTSAEKVAQETIQAIRKDKALVVISPAARVLWWLTRISPGIRDWLIRAMLAHQARASASSSSSSRRKSW